METQSLIGTTAPTSRKREWKAENPVILAVSACISLCGGRVAPNQRLDQIKPEDYIRDWAIENKKAEHLEIRRRKARE